MADQCEKRSLRENKSIVIATRLHLGRATTPPSESKLQSTLQNFVNLSSQLNNAHLVIAVDAAPKIDNYDYVEAVKSNLPPESGCVVLPVTPWGKFVPALNALLRYAVEDVQADYIMFVSAEVSASTDSIISLCGHVEGETLVAGAAMNGHVYSKDLEVELTGRTCPWNTLAVWDAKKLSLTGFQMLSDMGANAGVEECLAIALHQKIFPESKAKLVGLLDISWEESFDDEERRRWHEQKMNSKLERAGSQMQTLSLSGKVTHL